MKKRMIILGLTFLFLFPLVSAVEFNINQNFSQGETIIAKISGNFISPITNDNVFFYSGHVRIPMEYNVAKLGEDYYLYALTSGKAEGNYSVSIQNIQYMKGNEVSKDNLAANFSITNNTADFSVNPGFVYISGDFSLEVQNLKDKKLNINVNTETNNSGLREIFISPDSKYSSVSLTSGEIEKINFNVGSGSPEFKTIELKSDNLTYEIPVYIFSSSIGNDTKSFEIDPPNLVISIPTNTTVKKSIYIYNLGNQELENISLSLSEPLSPFITLSQNKITTLGSKSGVQIDLSFFSSAEKNVIGSLRAVSENASFSSLISLTFIKNYTSSNESVLTKTCSELNGNICSQNTQCDKEPIYAKDNVCCLGTCNPLPTSNSGTVIGIIILVVIIIAFVFFYKKYKKAKKPINLLEIAKGKKQIP